MTNLKKFPSAKAFMAWLFVMSLYDLEKEKLGEDADLYKYLNDVKFNHFNDFDYTITFSN